MPFHRVIAQFTDIESGKSVPVGAYVDADRVDADRLDTLIEKRVINRTPVDSLPAVTPGTEVKSITAPVSGGAVMDNPSGDGALNSLKEAVKKAAGEASRRINTKARTTPAKDKTGDQTPQPLGVTDDGAKVWLKSGSPEMTVMSYAAPLVTAEWIVTDGDNTSTVTGEFVAETLTTTPTPVAP